MLSDRTNSLDPFKCSDFDEEFSGEGEFLLDIETNAPDNTKLLFWAANPPQYNGSFSGSGLPFPNPDIAFDNTPNVGIVKIKDRKTTVNLFFPNSFYVNLGNTLIPPRFYYKFCESFFN